jgi:hypothetical protein
VDVQLGSRGLGSGDLSKLPELQACNCTVESRAHRGTEGTIGRPLVWNAGPELMGCDSIGFHMGCMKFIYDDAIETGTFRDLPK